MLPLLKSVPAPGCCRKESLVPKFKEYDVDGNGFITLEEASHILQNQPFNFPPTKVCVLLKNFDKDGNGKLDIEEFAGFYAEAKATWVRPTRFMAPEKKAEYVSFFSAFSSNNILCV